MSLMNGDWVSTPGGQVGEVLLVSGPSAFVEVQVEDSNRRISSFLLSRLTKVDPPTGAGHQRESETISRRIAELEAMLLHPLDDDEVHLAVDELVELGANNRTPPADREG